MAKKPKATGKPEDHKGIEETTAIETKDAEANDDKTKAENPAAALPAGALEKPKVQAAGLNFASAVNLSMTQGVAIKRKGWVDTFACYVGANDWKLSEKIPFKRDSQGGDLHGFLGKRDHDDKFGPWEPTPMDVAALDWEVV